MKRILLIGSSGTIGQALMPRLMKYFDNVISPSHYDLDITNPTQISNVIKYYKPDMLINAAACTDVERAEMLGEKPWLMNSYGPMLVARVCVDLDIPIMHFSTDYVFPGEERHLYTEEDAINPLNIYGASKAAGDMFLKQITKKHFIIRTSRLFGYSNSCRVDFVKRILNKLQAGQIINVVDDQYGSPTFSVDLADAIMRILLNNFHYGTYNICNRGICSWYEFALKIAEIAGCDIGQIKPIKTKNLETKVIRPEYSPLSVRKYEFVTGSRLRNWEDALFRYINDKKFF